MKTYALEWKCRKCWKLEHNPKSFHKEALVSELVRRTSNNEVLLSHSCQSGAYGVADLMGLVELEEKETA